MGRFLLHLSWLLDREGEMRYWERLVRPLNTTILDTRAKIASRLVRQTSKVSLLPNVSASKFYFAFLGLLTNRIDDT